MTRTPVPIPNEVYRARKVGYVRPAEFEVLAHWRVASGGREA